MFHELDATLKELLLRGLPAERVESGNTGTPISISFDTPDNQFPPTSVTLPAINLFLYDIKVNKELGTNGWQLERQSNGVAERKIPPVRVDCSYLITAWASDGSSDPANDEHRLLGEVMQVLLAYPTLPTQILQGGLVDQELPLPTVSLASSQLQSLAEFWQALGGKPKVAFNYTVTLAVDVQKAISIPLVTSAMIKIQQGNKAAP
jgi:hypothetical protein